MQTHSQQVLSDSKAAGEELKQAHGHKLKSVKYKLGMIFTGVGAAVGAVLGLGVGAVVGGAGGAVVGTSIGSKVENSMKKKQRNIEFEGE